MAYHDDELLYNSLRWSIIIITIVNIFYTLYIFFTYFRDTTRERSVKLIVWTTLGVLIFAIGLYGAASQQSIYLIVFGIVLLINLIFGFFQAEIYKGSIVLYILLIILTFVFAYLVNKRGG